jgi:dimethylhistidine N-methyltransferase
MNVKEDFLKDVLKGLSSSPKKLSSKYFYDENGDRLFHYIMAQPEYYLTCAEHEILQKYNQEILSLMEIPDTLRIIEPGAGDGFKTRVLLEAALSRNHRVIYNPIDISSNVLAILCDSIVRSYPKLLCEPVVADYFELEGKIPDDNSKRLMLFLGSNLGNFTDEESFIIMRKFTSEMRSGDYFLLGVDLVKEPSRILAAYNDSKGVTAEFNFNLLTRINLELQANFNLDNFQHFPVYNPVLQQAESYLVSKLSHDVTVNSHTFHFSAWEPMLTEISRKFNVFKIENLANYSGFKILHHFFDDNNDFACSLWEKI